MNLGRKLCLFVYYVEQINKQWMVEEATTFNGGVKSRMVHHSIRRRIQEQCGKFVCFLDLVAKEYRWSLLRFVVAAFDFRYANDYTMASHVFLLVLDSIRGLMLRVDDKQKEVRAVKIGACKGIRMHKDLG